MRRAEMPESSARNNRSPAATGGATGIGVAEISFRQIESDGKLCAPATAEKMESIATDNAREHTSAPLFSVLSAALTCL